MFFPYFCRQLTDREMVDLFDKLRMEAGPLAKYSHLPDDYFFFPKLEGEIGPRMKFNGKNVLNWSLNNYLGLANHPEVRKADADAAAQYGLGLPMGARMMSGNSVHHLEFERQLAEFIMKEDVMLLNFGYQGVVSIIDALVDRKDVEKAKVLLMQLHGLPEDTAFQLLRKNAMSHRITIGEMARRLLDAQKLLNDQLKDE